MDANQLFKLWMLDKANISLATDLVSKAVLAKDETLLESFYLEFSASDIDKPTLLVKLTEAFIQLGNFTRASAIAEELTKLTNNHALALHYVVLTQFLMGNNQQVIAYYKENQLLPESICFVARAFYLQGEIDNAIDILRHLPGVETNAEAAGVLAIMYFDKGNIANTQKYAALALSINNQQFESMLAMASFHSVHHQFAEAMPFIEQCLMQQPKNGRALSLKGQALLYALSLEEAIATLHDAAANMPEHIGTWHLLGWSYWLTNNIVEARNAFNRGLELNPKFSESYGALACVAISENDLEQGKHLAKKSLKLDKDNFSGRYAQALIFAAEGDEKASNQVVDSIISGSADATGTLFIELINKAKALHIK